MNAVVVTKQMQAEALTRHLARHPPRLKLTEGQRRHIMRAAVTPEGKK